MTKHRLQQELNVELESEFVEMDPTGRYGRYKEVLGKGASKIVYRAFDEIEGIEVAWNQVKVKDVLQTPEDLERLYSEVHLLKTLKHKNIIKFYSSWVDTKTKNINFVTEMFTSGNLRQYRQRHKHVDIRAVKNWSRQILRGLLYLHSHDPPIIHRDLKCDNIFVNGNQGEVKIGDLGLAAILRKSHAAHTIIGTPEFMAPELYEEEYNELVDIYAFGMCLLEMLTFEYPYSECSNPAQIYKKVISGRKPAALYRVKDPEVRQFVEKCLATVSRRLPARELLMDPFLQSEGRSSEYSFPTLGIYKDDMAELGPFVLEPRIEVSKHGGHNAHRNMQTAHLSRENGTFDRYEAGEHYKVVPSSLCFKEDALSKNRDFTVKGKKRDDDTIFLRLRIADKEGRVRNIYFPFDVEGDTALSVASEMVTELDITDQDVTKIADMIDEEILALVPDWKAGVDVEDCHTFPNHNHFISNTTENCCSSYNVLHHMSAISSNSSLLEYLKSHNCGTEVAPCTRVECAAVHGRFEEVTYKVDETDFSSYVAEEAPTISSESSDVLFHDADDWINEEDPVSPRLNILHASGTGNSDKSESCSVSSVVGNKEGIDRNKPAEPIGNMGLVDGTWRHGFPERFNPFHEEDCFSSVPKSELYLSLPSTFDTLSDEDEDSVIRELRLLTANHQEELKELQRKHEVALLEIQNRWRKRKDLRPFPGMPKFSPEAKSQEWKMSLNGWQEHQKDGCNRHCRAARDTLKCENNEFESVTMNRLVPDAGRMGISESDSSRSSPRNPAVSPDRHPVSRQAMTCSPPPKPDNKTSPSNRRLMKMHSFGDVDGHLCMRSLAVEVGRLQHEQTIGAFRTETLNATKDCHGALRCASSIPRTSSPRNYVEGRAQRNLHQPEYFV